jgi:hypothetical protein
MYINVLGHRKTTLPDGWGSDVSVSVLGSARIDATSPSQQDAKLTIVAVLCGVTVLVPEGTQLHLSGGDILGSHSVDVEPSPNGQHLSLEPISFLGSIKIKSG